MGLMGSSCRSGAPTRPGPCWPTPNPSEADYANVEASLREIARQVAARAPRAELIFVQYVTLVPPAPCDAARLVPEDAPVSRAIGRRLAEITARVARESGAMVLPADEMSRDHSACSAEPWSRGMPVGYDGSQGAAWHPTAAGHAAIADALAARLRGR
jgi:lysophospholipase L1-like esterase